MIQRIRAAACFVSVALLLSGTTTAAPFGFKPFIAYQEALPSWPVAVAVGDVSGDGRDDAVLATNYNAAPAKDFSLFIYAQSVQGTLQAPVQLPFLGTAGGFGAKLEMADLNNDGIKDVVVGHDQGITVVMALGGMRFKTTKTELPGEIYAMAVADINGDRKADVVR